MSENKNWIIRHGQVLDPKCGEMKQSDIVITNGKISAMGANLHRAGYTEVDCTGLIITPGLVDLHTHTCMSTQQC